jgi:hypothetical protein
MRRWQGFCLGYRRMWMSQPIPGGPLIAAVALAVLSSGPALAQPSPSTPPEPPLQQQVRWNERWRRVATWEYVVTASVLGGALALRAVGPEPPDNWRGGILFDDAVGDRVRIENPALADPVETMTDIFYFGSMAYRLVDSAILPATLYNDTDLALQLSMIDLESFALVAGVMFGSQVFIGRQRPEYDESCDQSASEEESTRCQRRGSRFRSFIAGHPAAALTAAGLTCTHHAELPLYGQSGDILACGLTLGAAAFTAAGRVMASKHYASDLVLGLGLGTFAGFILPRLLHYGFSDRGHPARAGRPRTTSAWRVGVYPWSDGSSLGLAAVAVN